MTHLHDLAADLTAPWRRSAACAGMAWLMDPPPVDPGLTHLEALVSERQLVRDAKTVCMGCSVRADCLAWVSGLDQRDDPGGVIAGHTQAERDDGRRTARRRAAQAARREERRRAELKICSRCKHDLPRDQFNQASDTVDGLHYWCRTCHNTEKARARAELRNSQMESA